VKEGADEERNLSANDFIGMPASESILVAIQRERVSAARGRRGLLDS
jgi:hypothetical protein